MNKVIFAALFFTLSLFAEEKVAEAPLVEVKEEVVETPHVLKIAGQEIKYVARAGTLPIKNKAGKVTAGMFFVSYTKEDVSDSSKRPITFCFNGGPGSSSVWLHMGVMGPKRIYLPLSASPSPPYELIDNEYSLLDLTDLVFIDPISTGFSKTVSGEDPKQFHGVEEDVQTFVEFIMQYTSKYKRWDSPKYLAGESYGATRAASLALKLHDDEFYYLNGIILISSVLNYQTIFDPNDGNDLPYILNLPSFTAAAWTHHRLSDDRQKDYHKTLAEAEKFAIDLYGPALLKGDLLKGEEKMQILAQLSSFTGLSQSFIERCNLRVSTALFTKELLESQNKIVGRFDARYLGIDTNLAGCNPSFDPSLEAIAGAYTASFNQYLRSALNWEKGNTYRIASFNEVSPWNWGKCRNSFLNVGENLREVMSKNPTLHLFVAAGEFDLATPYFATEYTLNHLNLDSSLKKNISLEYYEAGHMMYLDEPSLIKMKKDLTKFYKL